jgi:hypothetical protein
MKKKTFTYLVLVAFLTSAGIILGGALISMLQAHSDGNDIIVEWQTTQETNLKEFVVQRKTANSEFIDIATIHAKGGSSYYTFRDESAFKTTGTLYIYRLKTGTSSLKAFLSISKKRGVLYI